MHERHTLYHRPTLLDEPKKIRSFKSYKSAVLAGMSECGHGKFWVDSEHRTSHASRWTEFNPEPLKNLEYRE